ncbi:hypothetical protein JX265_001334 [Neoarthrinium moseri]|uniref:Endo-chitosanase n=1 Tax=Neoarthrinium moseri TaxID=1658444 RepID=A0A9Q0AWC8_9PEZI|nr:hypothetical protein JX266_011781 [Neoarthrinium moseri]KAI1881094.1 hypothetical protein JX265_001334 [Neoarthrinium moseri]
MKFYQLLAMGPLLMQALVHGRTVPGNIQSFYTGIVNNQTCQNKLASGFYSTERSRNTFSYCGDHLDDYKVIYIQGTNGALADMDVDCDGDDSPSGDRRCESAEEREPETSFQDIIRGYKKEITELNSVRHSWVVLGNVGRKPKFNPKQYGVLPLSIVAVVCNNQLFYGVWGDEYGVDEDERHGKQMIGEASLALATACFGHSMNGNNGHEPNDVLYIAFPGPDAVPGANGAKWNARSWSEFHASIENLGNKLIQRIPGAGNWTRPALNSPQWK